MTANAPMCPRVEYRMACYECGYPYFEAAVDTDERLPHFLTECEDVIDKIISEYEELLARE